MKYYKIKYTLNLLPAVTYRDGDCDGVDDLLDAVSASEEESVFETKVIKDFYGYMWRKFAHKIHVFGFIQHLIYVILFTVYIHEVYLYRHFYNRTLLSNFMGISLIYPAYYDILQLSKIGPKDYFAEFWNWIDQAHIWIGISNALLQRFNGNILAPLNLTFMILVALLVIVKTFFFLRIFK